MRFALPLVILLSASCAPPCSQVCRKILDCGNLDSERVAFEECELACEVQQTLYRQWEDEVKEQAFNEHKRCLRSESCEDIEAGVCYDEEIFIF